MAGALQGQENDSLLPSRDVQRRLAAIGLMPGFFKIDNDDYDNVWSLRENEDLFPVYVTLLRRAWRQEKPRQIHERHYRITLWMNQLILHIRQLASEIGLPESTLRDRLRKLETMEAIRIDKPVHTIVIITILWAYNYGDHGDRTPCVFRAPSVIDLRADRDHTEYVSPLDTDNRHLNNNIQRSYTEDSRLEDSENQNRLVRREGFGGRDLHDDIPKLAAMLREKTPDLTEEQANEKAEALLLYEDSELCPLD